MGIETDKIHKDDAHLVEEFECIICRNFAEDPRQCSNCKKFFCNSCITEWYEKNQTCPIKCKTSPITVEPLEPETLTRYNNINVLCSRNCGKYIKLENYLDHTTLCHLPDCTPTCGRKSRYSYAGISTCSYNCLVKNHESMKNDPDLALDKIQEANPGLDLSHNFPIIFDSGKTSTELIVSSPNTIRSTSEHNEHQTALSKVGLLGGVHRIKFSIGPSERPVKVGVTKATEVPQNTAFSDFETGFAFYTVGQTRNESDGSGLLYGTALKSEEAHTIVMELVMGEGEIRFSLDGNLYGSAFDYEKELIKEGPFYVAIAVRKQIESAKAEPVNSI